MLEVVVAVEIVSVTRSRLTMAIVMAARAHDGQVDKAGEAYIWHPLRVAMHCSPADRVIAVLHDVIEDAEYPDHMRRAITSVFGEDDALTLDYLTHRENEDYSAYISRVAEHPQATRIKIQDLTDNMNMGRLAIITKEDTNRLRKYTDALSRLMLVQQTRNPFAST